MPLNPRDVFMGNPPTPEHRPRKQDVVQLIEESDARAFDLAKPEADRAKDEADRSAAASQLSFANAKGAPTIAEARGLVADTETFIVYEPGAPTFTAYRRTSTTTEAMLGKYPTAANVDDVVSRLRLENLYDPDRMRVADSFVSSSGEIGPASGFAYAKIPVTPGLAYSWASNTTRRVGSVWLDINGEPVDGSASYSNALASGGLSQTRTAPVGAVHLAINVLSTSIPEPTELMVNVGTVALPYVTGRPNSFDFLSRSSDVANRALSDLLAISRINKFHNGDFIEGLPPTRSNSSVVALDQIEMQARGLSRGIQWRDGNEFFRYASGGSLLNKYYFAAFVIYSEDGSNLIAGPTCFMETSGGGLTEPVTGVTEGFYPISETARIVWETGIINEDVPNFLVGSAIAPDVPGTRFASEVTLFLSDAPLDKDQSLLLVNTAAAARAQALKYSRTSGGGVAPQSGLATLYLAPVGPESSYVESGLSGSIIRTDFVAFPSQTRVDVYPVTFNFASNTVDGVTVRTAGDDIAPDHILVATLGANHGWTIGRCTATGHGKALADQGAIFSSGGVECMIVQVIDVNTLTLARRMANTAPATGTYTHVSGATNTASFSVSAVTNAQWYPPFENYQMRVVVDGRETSDRGTIITYRNTVQFVESYDLLDRPDVITWWEANGDSGNLIPNGDPSCTVTICYEFDRYGQLTIYRDFTALKTMAVADLMGLQAGRAGNPTGYYLPQTIEFTEGAETFNYSLIEPADRLSSGGLPANFITPARCEPTGPLADRFLSLYGSDYVFAMGFLPVGSTGLAERRTNCTANVWEIRGTSDKVYGRYLDVGDTTLFAGDTYSTIAYRWIGPKPAGRTSSYPILTQGADYFFADWHDFSGLDRIALPVEFLGRDFEIVASRNAAVISQTLTGNLLVNVAATSGYGFIQMKVLA